jgi:hypothetical protein
MSLEMLFEGLQFFLSRGASIYIFMQELWVLQLSLLWAPSHISPQSKLTTFTNNYVHVEIKITASNESQSFLVAHLVGWVLLNFGLCYGS